MLTDRLEAELKNVIFEATYLNEKLMKRSNKTKNVLHPKLQQRQILNDVLKSIWAAQPNHKKIDEEYRQRKLLQQAENQLVPVAEEEKKGELTDVDRAKAKDSKET